MHEAYYVYPPATIPVQIESIASFDNNVILGTRQGHLLMYSVEQHPSEQKMDLQLLQYDKNFSKKPINQIDVIPEYQLLFSLSDNIVNINDFNRHNFPLIHCATKTKGASIFALDVQRSKSLTGEIALVVRLCVAIKRRLHFWYWKHDRLIEFGEPIDLIEVPKSLVWLDNTICIGYKTEYILYDISKEKPVKRDLFPTSSSKTIDPCIGVINDCFAVAKDEFLIGVEPKVSGLNDPNDKSLLDFGAKDTENKKFKSLTWSQPIQVLVWDEPYAVALIPNSLEIRVLDASTSVKDTFIQTLPELKNARHLVRSKKGMLFAASVAQLWCIKSVDIPKQRQNLLQQKKFQLALQLTDISEESEDEKQAKKHQIQTLYAFDSFSNKYFKEAMKEFAKLQTDPCDVIRLFPDLWPQDGPMSTPTKTSSAATVAAKTILPKLVDKDLELGLLALIDYLTEVRYNLQKELHSTDLKSQQNNTNRLLMIIDTTLLKCYLQTNDSLVASLLRLNYCNLEESEKTLRAYEKFGELIILYQTKGHHRKALQLLQSQAFIPDSCLSGHERTIQYLQHLGTEHRSLIFEFSNWVIEKHPDDGLKIFTEDIHEVENLPRAEVLDHILKNHKLLAIPYLEHVINVWNDTHPMFHNILIRQYLEGIMEIKHDLQASPAGTDKQKELERDNVREKLVEFLDTSNYYTPELVLKSFPEDNLFEERAIILGKQGKHVKVLAIYIQILGDIHRATVYCENVYATANESNVFAILIKTLLQPPTTPPYANVPLHPLCLTPNVDAVLELLERHAAKINPYAVLQILPDNIPLVRLRTFLETALHNSLERRRNNQILKGLLYAENLQFQEQRMHLESKSVVISEISICPVCMKKFTNQSAFVRYPDGKIVHFSCQEKPVSKVE